MNACVLAYLRINKFKMKKTKMNTLYNNIAVSYFHTAPWSRFELGSLVWTATSLFTQPASN